MRLLLISFLCCAALTSYAPAGEFEGVLSYGIGVGRPTDTVPETKVRVYEVDLAPGARKVRLGPSPPGIIGPHSPRPRRKAAAAPAHDR